MKTYVSGLEKGGYSPEKFIPYLLEAISNAENADTNKSHFLPSRGVTKIYELGDALIQVIGKSDFEKFIKNNIPNHTSIVSKK